MLWWMLKVDGWLDVAPLESMEDDHNFLFLVPKEEFNEDFSWDFRKNWKSWLMIFFFGFESKLRSTSPMPLVLRLFENSLFSFHLSLSLSLFLSPPPFFFFFEKPILWMRITLARSWCRLLDKSLLSSCKKIISIRNEFFHWNELEVLTQCP